MKLVVINGKPKSGKDEFADMVIEELKTTGHHGAKFSSVDKVKEAAMILGWHGEKDLEARKFLSDLKDLSTKHYEGPMKYMEEMIDAGEQYESSVLFFHIREPEEIAKFKSKYKDAIALMVDASYPGFENMEASNHADARTHLFEYDVVIENNGELWELKAKAQGFADYIRKENTACE